MIVPQPKLFAILAALALAPAIQAQEAPTEQVFLEADILIDDRENGTLIAEGNVVASYGGRELTADRVIYDLETQTVHAIGNVIIFDPDGTIRTADEIEVDGSLSDGYATDFAAQLPQNAVVVARTAARDEAGSNSLEYAIYTACPICEEEGTEPTWTLRARRAVQNAETQMITYRDAVFEIKGVPILYLPYFAHPDPTSERRSGLLTPTPELSSKLGVSYKQPYYWAISPYQDLTITPKLYSNVNSALDLQYRRRFYSGGLNIEGSMAYDYEFDSQGDRQFYDSRGRIVSDTSNYQGELTPSEEDFRGHIFAEGLFAINPTWQWGFAIENATDDLYLRRYDIDGANLSRGLLDVAPKKLLNQIYAVGQTQSFYTDVAAYHVQGLSAGDNDGDFPRVVPMAYANKLYDFGNLGFATVEGSLAFLDRSEGNDVRRVSALAEWQNSYISPGGIILEPLLQVSADQSNISYRTTAQTAGYEDDQSRTSALAAATLRWPFLRPGKNVDISFEPVVTIAYGDSSLDNGIVPNEDLTRYEYELTSLFEADPFSHYDLIEQGGRIAAGFRTSAHFDNGITLRGTAGRRWRDEADPAFSYASNLAGTRSDYLVGGGFDIGRAFSFDTSLRLDDDFDVVRFETNTSFEFWRMRGDITYFNLDESISFYQTPEQAHAIDLTWQFELTESVDLMYALRRNMDTQENDSQAFAVQWSDDCSFFRIGWRQRGISDRGVGSSDTITFGFGFNTLGRVTSGDFE